MHGSEFACRCTNFPVKFVFINPRFCVGSGVRLFQGRFCAYAMVINEAPGVACKCILCESKMSLCCFCTAYVMHMDCIRTANRVCVKQVLERKDAHLSMMIA